MAAVQDYFQNFLQTGKGNNSQYSNSLLASVDKFFSISDRGSNFFDEWRGGTATFLAMAYILAVNPAIVAASGGTCGDDHIPFSPEYNECKREILTDLIIATATSAFVATFLMGMTANLPLALAPGMGLNAYFTYEVVGFNGSGDVDYRTALGAVLLEGCVFLILAIVGARQVLGKMLPKAIKFSTAVGIGLFLAHIGLQQAEGIGLVTSDVATGIELGGCGHRKYSDNMVCGDFTWGDCAEGYQGEANGACGLNWFNGEQTSVGDQFCHCRAGKMSAGTVWLGIAGFVIMSALIQKKWRGSIIIGILFVTFISWIPGHSASMFDCQPAFKKECDDAWDNFKKVAEFRPLKHTGSALEVHLNKADIWLALLTFFYVDVLDTTGTLYSMASYMKIVDADGNFDGMHAAFSVDAIATIIGALMGTSPVTTFIESADGIREGGRTGLASVVTAFYFLLGIFFSPILSSIPPWAMGPALIIVGALMMKQVTEINWDDPREAIPAFVTIALMPLTYSIAYGIIGGLFMAVIMWLVGFLPGEEGAEFVPQGVDAVDLGNKGSPADTEMAKREASGDGADGHQEKIWVETRMIK